MRKILMGCLLLAISQLSLAQSSTVKGKIVDTLERKNLQYAVVTLIKKSDSTLYKFTRTQKDGSFLINGVAAGSYLLNITYPKFADYADVIEVKDQPENDLGNVPLTPKSQLLEAVVIKSAGAIRIKGDTTEFVADSFAVREGATVEDLLKKLPGFQVNAKGEITTQGQKVGKVLVDGEEFFGDDPTMATQNISAKAVDKVQVYDTKTEQQNLTGISSGQESKTVNIKLKEDSKKGAFGKAHFGTDFQKLIDAKVLYNKFQGKKKVSVYGTKSDISTGSLNWEDKQKLGIEEDYEYDEIAGYYYSFNSDEFNDWSLKGLPDSYTAGALFSNKWNEDRNGLNISYRFNRLGTRNEASTLTQNILATGVTTENILQNSQGLNQQHNAMGKYEWKLDSLASFKFTSTVTYKTTELLKDDNSEYFNEFNVLRRHSIQHTDNSAEKTQNDNILTYKQLFSKKNRQLIATLRYGMINDNQDGIYQYVGDSYSETGTLDSTTISDQLKVLDGSSRTMGGKITWSEPLNTKWNFIAEYGFNTNKSASYKNTYNKTFNGKYEELDLKYSNNFDLNAYAHSGTAILKYTDKKLRAAFGSGISSIKLKLDDLYRQLNTQYDFLNLTPQASFRYNFKPQTGISMNYRGTTRQPTIDQLQPIQDNSDPNNIFIGNPALKVGFNHSVNLGYNSYKTLSQTYFSVNIYGNVPVNAISYYNIIYVETGKRTYTPVNVNGNRNMGLWAYYWKDGGENKWGYGFNANASGGRSNNFLNEFKDGQNHEQKNTTTYINSDFGFSLRYGSEKRSISIHPTAGYNISESTVNTQNNTAYWNYGGNIDGNLTLPWKLEIWTEINFNLRQKIEPFAGDPSQINWNGHISRKVLKDKGKIYFVFYDILNQNIGFDRQISSNFIKENRYSKIGQYFLLKFEWTLNKMPGQTK